jgi:hypothetical protein
MGRFRPRLKSVVAIALLWQLAAAMLFSGPALAAVHASTQTSTPASHCHATAATGQLAGDASESGPTGHATTSPDCCISVNACHCLCAQGTAADAQLTVLSPVTDRPVEPSLRSPPLLRRTSEVFRPPI